jgi:hypothetical protein
MFHIDVRAIILVLKRQSLLKWGRGYVWLCVYNIDVMVSVVCGLKDVCICFRVF